jgi:hypothetical protein
MPERSSIVRLIISLIHSLGIKDEIKEILNKN